MAAVSERAKRQSACVRASERACSAKRASVSESSSQGFALNLERSSASESKP